MPRAPFTFQDICRECHVDTGIHALHGTANPKRHGARIVVPAELMQRYPYNASAYVLLQQLRAAIFELGTLEFPQLPVNKTNHTLAQRAPREHLYSNNPYLTGEYQHLHQDTPPYPTAFWLNAPRRFFATWVVALPGLQRFTDYTQQFPEQPLQAIHKKLVAESLANGTGVLLNQSPGLLLIDNSEQQQLYHARTCQFSAIEQHPDYSSDTPLYAFNEIGLLHYIDTLDERRGQADRCAQDLADMAAFMATERLALR